MYALSRVNTWFRRERQRRRVRQTHTTAHARTHTHTHRPPMHAAAAGRRSDKVARRRSPVVPAAERRRRRTAAAVTVIRPATARAFPPLPRAKLYSLCAAAHRYTAESPAAPTTGGPVYCGLSAFAHVCRFTTCGRYADFSPARKSKSEICIYIYRLIDDNNIIIHQSPAH